MQRKCHRCDRLFTPDSHSPWCPNCRAGKPVEPRKTKEQLEQEREERLEKHLNTQDTVYSVERSFIQMIHVR